MRQPKPAADSQWNYYQLRWWRLEWRRVKRRLRDMLSRSINFGQTNLISESFTREPGRFNSWTDQPIAAKSNTANPIE